MVVLIKNHAFPPVLVWVIRSYVLPGKTKLRVPRHPGNGAVIQRLEPWPYRESAKLPKDFWKRKS